jgi:hypothetical protein
MHIITLTSDWNENDYYVASIKGKLLSGCPEVTIVDVTHGIKSFNTAQAAFVVRNSYPSFPKDTIHLIAVNTEPEKGGQLLAARISNQFFVCADNGLLGLLGDPEPELVVKLNESLDEKPVSFVTMHLFADVACALVKGTPMTSLGTPTSEYNKQTPLRPTLEAHTITGGVLYVDSYGNAITNISRELFDRIGNGRSFQIFVQSKHYTLHKINQRYNESPPGELLAIFNSAGLLEIAIRNGYAAGLLNLNTNSSIRVEFKVN